MVAKSDGLIVHREHSRHNSAIRLGRGASKLTHDHLTRGNEALTSRMTSYLSLGISKRSPKKVRGFSRNAKVSGEERSVMEASRKPLAKVEGRRRMPLSGLTIAWRGTPNLGDWVAYIVRTKSKKFLLVDHASERTVNT